VLIFIATEIGVSTEGFVLLNVDVFEHEINIIPK